MKGLLTHLIKELGCCQLTFAKCIAWFPPSKTISYNLLWVEITTLCILYITHFMQPYFMEFLGFQNRHPKFPSVVNKPHHMCFFLKIKFTNFGTKSHLTLHFQLQTLQSSTMAIYWCQEFVGHSVIDAHIVSSIERTNWGSNDIASGRRKRHALVAHI